MITVVIRVRCDLLLRRLGCVQAIWHAYLFLRVLCRSWCVSFSVDKECDRILWSVPDQYYLHASPLQHSCTLVFLRCHPSMYPSNM